jgi:1-acyl-sn-glycerol-3-phosphate acyltransferase
MPEGQARFHKANKTPLGEWAVHAFVARGLRAAFGGLYVRIEPATLGLRRHTPCPVIFCLTHSGWFDGHIAAVLNKRVFRHDAYLMMEEPNLARYPFFTWAGVFGIDRDDARNALASIEYITGLLADGEHRALWMFPQGTMRHPDERPLKLFGGVTNIARRLGRCLIVPVAIRYDFMLEQAPDAYVRMGAPILFDLEGDAAGPRGLTERLRLAMEAEADTLHAEVTTYNREGYRRVLTGRGSINRIWDRALESLGRLRRLLGGSRE